MQLTLKVFGRVQGVWFRDSACQIAEKLGLNGFAQNEKDGSVTVVAVGRRADLDQLKKWCAHGPRAARVERTVAAWHETDSTFDGFTVR